MTEPIWRELNAWVMEHAGPLASSAENELCDIVGRLVAAEREACAKIAEEILNFEGYGGLGVQLEAFDGIPAAIRSRGETKE